MSRPPRKALLIGVTDYDDPAIDSLPFIADDLLDLGKALESIGYDVEHHPAQHGDRDRIDTAIEQFCRRAAPRQQLLIFLSGHGIHRYGRDYLLPSSADTTSRKFAERCLEIDFGGHIEESRCGDVLVVVDACREGVRLREKAGYGYVQSWSRQQRERSADRTIAYLYACSSGELARWKQTPDGTFSLFTRAFSRALTDAAVGGTLAAVRDAVRVRLEDLSATLGVPLQKPHLDGDPESGARLLLVDRPARAAASRGASGWADRARSHAVWDLAGPAQAGLLRDATVECAAAWSRRYLRLRRSLRDDPWWDDELAIRMHDRLSWIVKHVLNPGKLVEDDKPPLGAAEAAVLVLMPYAQQLHRAECAVAARPVLDGRGDEADEFRRYVEGRRRIQRRLDRLVAGGDETHAAAVRWAAYHRWLAQRPQLYGTEVVAGCLLASLDPPADDADELLRDVLTGDRLARLLRALRSDPETDAVAAGELPPGAQTVAGGSPDEQHVRDRLLALILLVAEEFTVDATALPDIVADHIGLRGGVEVGEVLRTVQTARWSARGRTRVLDAECSHQAVQVALAEHTHGIAEVLRRIDAAAEADRLLESLRDLPTHAAADGLRPLPRPDGRPRYDSVGFRFRLDDDRVQELLMGEQLYGDPALAIRELYQNALDACRHRRARALHLRGTGRWSADWSGRIAFTQGVDEGGRPWLECRDNGIGMSERELNSVFSHAGARFADLPEFLEEQATWDREQIEFYPNSRFGVGVLSYFMLGDEIGVSTARFSREGALLPRLQVDIDGPGSLCRIGEADGTGESGTTVRIYLRPGVTVSCVDLLTRLLWVSEFAVTAADGTGVATWAPDVLSSRAPVGSFDPMDDSDPDYLDAPDAPVTDPRPTSVRHVWWCDGRGALLADGLWAGEAPWGYIVDLTGRLAPRLTVDRRRMLAKDDGGVQELLRLAIPDLLACVPRVATLDWLDGLAREDVRLADLVAEAMIDAGATFEAGNGVTIHTAAVGVFPPDQAWFLSGEQWPGPRYSSQGPAEASAGEWRLRALLRAGLVPGLRLAVSGPVTPLLKPSDAILLSGRNPRSPWLDFTSPVGGGHILRVAAALDWSPRRVAARLRELGRQVPEVRWSPETIGDDDRRLLTDKDGRNTWLDLSEPVPAWYVMRAGLALGWPPRRVARRLGEWGALLPEFPWPEEPLRGDDERLLRTGEADDDRWDRPMSEPWLDLLAPVPTAHVVAVGVALEWPIRRAAERLRELGAQVPDAAWPETPLSGDDQLLLSFYLDGRGPWRDLSEPVPPGDVTTAAAALGRPPRWVAERLRQLGAVVEPFAWLDHPLSGDDRRLVSSDPSAPGGRLDLVEPIPPGHVVAAGMALQWTPRLVASRLRALGANVGDFSWPDVPATGDDLVVLSSGLNGRLPWRDLSEPLGREHVLKAALALGRPPRQVARSLAGWGARLADFPWLGTPLSESDRRLLTYRDAVEDRWDDTSPAGTRFTVPAPVSTAYVMAVGCALGWSPRLVAERLRELGADVPDRTWSDSRLTGDDRRLFEREGGGRGPMLELSRPVPAAQVLGVAGALGRSPRRVADRLRQLGIELADETWDWPAAPPTGDDQRLLSKSVDGMPPWLDLTAPIDAGHVFGAASVLGKSPQQVARRLRQWGARVPDLPWPATAPSSTDQHLFSRDLDGEGPWVAFDRPIGAGRLLPGLNGTSLSMGEAARRLVSLGATLPPGIEIVPDEPPK